MTNSIQLQLRRGTLAECQAMTPAMGELVVADDQAPPEIFLGDGSTPGGKRLIAAPDQLIATLSANQALAAGWQYIGFNASESDDNGLLDTANGIVTIKRAGLYIYSLSVAFNASVVSAAGVAYDGEAANNARWQGPYGGAISLSSNEMGMRLGVFAAGDTLQPVTYVNAACNLLATSSTSGIDTRFLLLGPF